LVEHWLLIFVGGLEKIEGKFELIAFYFLDEVISEPFQKWFVKANGSKAIAVRTSNWYR